jgi:putative intracellular protease/amidase
MHKPVVCVIAQAGFRDEELVAVQTALQRVGIASLVAAPQLAVAQGSLGGSVQPDIAIAEVDLARYGAVVVIGGHGAPTLTELPELITLLHQAKTRRLLLGAIAHGTGVLAYAGLVIGQRVTGHAEETQIILDRGGEYTGMPVEIGDRMITAKEPRDAQAFATAFVEALMNQ